MSEIKRTFFYIRKEGVKFYHEEGNTNYADDMDKFAKEIDSRLSFASGVINDNIHYFTLMHPDGDTFKKVTQNLYFEGKLKEEFKNCMRWAKRNKIAFGLSASKVGVEVPETYLLEHYYNIKTPDETFIDATFHQKKALALYDFLVVHPESYFTINFFDYNHDVKHVEVRAKPEKDGSTYWKDLIQFVKEEFPEFMQEKKDYNSEHNIEQESIVEFNYSSTSDPMQYCTSRINEFLPKDLQNLKLPIFI